MPNLWANYIEVANFRALTINIDQRANITQCSCSGLKSCTAFEICFEILNKLFEICSMKY